MRIGYVLGLFPKLSETFILNEIVELKKQGHEVIVFSISNPNEEHTHEEVKRFNILENVHYLLGRKKSRNIVKYGSKIVEKLKWNYTTENIANKLLAIKASKHFSKIANKLDLDILHAHFNGTPTQTAMLMSKTIKTPYTFTAHAADIFVKPNVSMLKLRISNSLATFVPSYYNKKYLHELTKVKKGKIQVVRPCPIISKLQKIKRNPEDYTILTVARLQKKKGIKYGILAVKKLVKQFPKIQYRIIGSGELENILKKMISLLSLEKNVKLLGSLDDASLMKELSKATLFILPCVKSKNNDMDSTPVSLMEAMYLKIPVISTKLAGIPEIIENGKEGLLVEPRNVNQLAEAIKLLLENEDLRRKMGENGKKKIEREFNIQKEIKKMLKIWKEQNSEQFTSYSM